MQMTETLQSISNTVRSGKRCIISFSNNLLLVDTFLRANRFKSWKINIVMNINKSTDHSAFVIDYEIVTFSKITISELFAVETRCA